MSEINNQENNFQFGTLAIHGGQQPVLATNARGTRGYKQNV